MANQIDCSCISGCFNFTICSQDSSKIVLCDLSEWMEESYYTLPESYIVKINTPNGSNKQIEYKPKGCTVISAKDLTGYNNFPDGVYCFTVDNCGIIYTQNIAILSQIREKIDKLYLDDSFKDKDCLCELESYYKYIEVNTKYNRKEVADFYFSAINKKISKLFCENC